MSLTRPEHMTNSYSLRMHKKDMDVKIGDNGTAGTLAIR